MTNETDSGAEPDPSRSGDKPATENATGDRRSVRSTAEQKHWPVFELFNEREHRVMNLASLGYSSKEMAGIEADSENAVDQVIKRARAKCGGASRRELVRAYANWKAAEGRKEIGPWSQHDRSQITDHFPVDHIPVLANESETAPMDASVHRDDAAQRSELAATNVVRPGSPYLSLHLPVGMGGSARNELDKLPRIVAILIIAAAGVVTAGAALALLFVLDHIAAGH